MLRAQSKFSAFKIMILNFKKLYALQSSEDIPCLKHFMPFFPPFSEQIFLFFNSDGGKYLCEGTQRQEWMNEYEKIIWRWWTITRATSTICFTFLLGFNASPRIVFLPSFLPLMHFKYSTNVRNLIHDYTEMPWHSVLAWVRS